VTAAAATAPATGPAGARRGRQRSQAADDAILAATLTELIANGYGGLTMAAVIARSGVSSATLYRRWPTKQQLVAAALASLHREIVDVDTGSLDGDVLALAKALADTMSLERPDLTEVVASELRRNPEFRAAINEKFHQPRVDQLGQILERARVRGELGGPVSADVAIAFVSGPLYHRAAITQRPLSAAFVRTVAQGAVGALRTLAPVS
jgi:AcrR family transcriptional regulator